MEQAQLTQRLFKTYRSFKQILTEAERTFSEFERKFNGDKCPEQDELTPVLRNFQKIALAFSEFLEVLDKVLCDENLVMVIQQMPPENKGVSVIDPRELLPFYWMMNSINNKMYEKGTSASYFWELTNALAIEYGYYGSGLTASTSLISQMSIITGVFGEGAKKQEIFLEFAPKFLKKEYIKGLYNISKRAALLATATEKEPHESKTAWWCDIVDATPKDKSTLYILGGLIKGCPDPKHPEVIKRLKELTVNQDIDESIREQAQLKLKYIEVS
jgi:hypothetical protein